MGRKMAYLWFGKWTQRYVHQVHYLLIALAVSVPISDLVKRFGLILALLEDFRCIGGGHYLGQGFVFTLGILFNYLPT